MKPALVPTQDPLGCTILTEFAGTFSPLGVALQLETNSREVLEACRASFGPYGGTLPRSRRSLFTIKLLVDESFTATPPWPDVVFRRQGDIFYASAGNQNVAVADLRQRQAFGFVSPAMAGDREFLQRNFVECLALTMMTRGRGATHTYVHASAVARGEKGLILSGPRESGKSTLAYACARRGFKIVADDVVYLRSGRSMTAWGRPWRLRLLPDCGRFFPELSEKAESIRSAGKEIVEIDVPELLPGTAQASCVPRALFFLKRSSTRARCEPLGADEALGLLARELVYDTPEVIERHRRAWAALVIRGSYALHWEGAPEAAVDLLESFLGA